MQKNCSDLRFRQSGRIALAIVDFLFLYVAGFESLKKYVMKSDSIEKGEEGKKELSKNGMFPCKMSTLVSIKSNKNK